MNINTKIGLCVGIVAMLVLSIEAKAVITEHVGLNLESCERDIAAHYARFHPARAERVGKGCYAQGNTVRVWYGAGGWGADRTYSEWLTNQEPAIFNQTGNR